jgi:hypothetical protein
MLTIRSSKLFAIAAVTAAALSFQSTPPHAQGAGAFNGLSGSWSGNGQVRLAGGRTEQLKCTAYYTERSGGNGLGLAIRCANASSKIEMRANLTNNGGRISGSWEERQYNAAGSVSGQSTGNRLQLSITGGGLQGSMSVTTSGRTQNVSITTSGTGLEGVTINLSKG